MALGPYARQVSHHLPSHTSSNFMADNPVIFQKKKKKKRSCQASPIPKSVNKLTDESLDGKASIATETQIKVVYTQETSAPKPQMSAVRLPFVMFPKEEFVFYTDSQPVFRLFPHLEAAVLPKNKTTIFHLLSKL